MIRTVVAVLVFSLASCTTSDDRFASYDLERDAYFKCAVSAGSSIAAGKPGVDAEYAAIAAKQLCGQERNAAINGIMKAHNPEIWRRLIQILDESFTEKVITTVVAS